MTQKHRSISLTIKIALDFSLLCACQFHRIGKDSIAGLFPVKPPCIMPVSYTHLSQTVNPSISGILTSNKIMSGFFSTSFNAAFPAVAVYTLSLIHI